VRTGLALRDPLPWHDLSQVVQSAEETGYEAVFVPEIAGREAFATLSGLAAGTTRLGLGTGVVSITSRRPETTAMAAVTVHESSGGRFILGLGAGTERRVEAVRSYVRLVRRILEGEEAGGFRLALQVGSVPLPIWLAALGPRMISLCGEIAEGVVLNWCSPERVETARRELSRAAERSGRDPADVTVGVYVRACLAHEDAQALEALRPAVGEYAAKVHYRRQFEAMGLGEEATMAAKAFRAGELSGVPEALVRAVCVFGSDSTARLEAYADAGADLVVVYPVAARDPLSSILGTVLAAAPSPAVEA
jgi:alkanesulfonate monooxygenase SsuD/methylene tetrahydromethanopterin reductase-like flavin-dependent oxidoreductase (luciferase family)